MIEDLTKVYRLSKIVDVPSGIDSMCLSPNKKFIAVGRMDCSLEIWTSDTWIQLIKIPGFKDCDLRKIFFKKRNKEETIDDLNNLRLFSIGLNGYVIEWCLVENKPKLSFENPGESAIWDCDLLNNKYLLIACEDGSPRCLQLKKNVILLHKQFSKQNTKVLCIKSNNYDSHNTFFTGHNDGSIKKWNFQNGQIELVINLTSSKIKSDTRLLIWSLFIVNNNTVCSGDSQGTLKLWDSKYGVLIKEFNEHKGDILTITGTSNSIFYTGCDSVINSLQYINDEWKLTSKFRGQSHDINSLLILNNQSLLSGGLTTDICIYKIDNGRFIEKYGKKANTSIKRHISGFDHKAKIYLTDLIENDVFFILHRKSNNLDLWYVNPNSFERLNYLAQLAKKVFRFKVQGQENIISANISKKAEYIVYSDSTKNTLFKYSIKNNELKKLKINDNFKNNPSRFLFFPDKDLVASVTLSGKLLMYNINKNQIEKEIPLFSKKTVMLNCDMDPSSSLLCLTTLDKQIVLVDLISGECIKSFPHPNSLVNQIKFLDNNTVIIIDENNKFYLINVRERQFHPYTRDNFEKFPSNYLTWYNKVLGIAEQKENINGAFKFLLFTDYNYIDIDTSKEIPERSVIEKNKIEKQRHADWEKKVQQFHSTILDEHYKTFKIERELMRSQTEISEGKNLFENDNFKIINRFSSILYMKYLRDNVLLVVENDWNKIIKSFPTAVSHLKYGY